MNSPELSRRTFLHTAAQTTVAGLALSALPIERFAHAAGSDEIKVALIGCGGRGTGAVNQSMNSQLQLMPEKITWDMAPPVVPDADGNYPIAQPGRTVAL